MSKLSSISQNQTWESDFQRALSQSYDKINSELLYAKYAHAFSEGYKEAYSPEKAVSDIHYCEKLNPHHSLEMCFYRPVQPERANLDLKLYYLNHAPALSDILPMLENMGLRVLTEFSYHIQLETGEEIFLSDFSLHSELGEHIEFEETIDIFQDAFTKVWTGEIENDQFNRLVLSAHLSWREINILRAYAKFFRQIGVTFSQDYINQALTNQPKIARLFIELFNLYFNPAEIAKIKNSDIQISEKSTEIITALDQVTSLDEDKILRRYLNVIAATVRTNFFQIDDNKQPKSYLSFKIKSSQVIEMPLPHPLFEIFVYSAKMEGIHLRAAKVARGGIRWSDRFEDYRTEVLGLMKAQQVKNSIIVPAGAKGGFVCKRLPTQGSREEIMQAVIACYSTFIDGLLELTDNLSGNKIIFPDRVVRRDEDDSYLVVAADKGTASFSDIANSLSKKHNFWLGDAFASGGSTGYDHKKIGITARGAWVSVTRHFHALGLDIQNQDFTVVGIGDMSGDVFGNGMLLSPHIKMIAAFNHQHIFIDPNPTPAVSFAERKRLFELPRSTWEDYNPELISKGGGVFKRSVKLITLSQEIKEALQVNQDQLMPTELIQAILKAPVDLLWNGGIGTYVKASNERHTDVGDRANDILRINGKDLRCKVVGEGGNLGFTQLGRVEYALNGGNCYTDFVDNSAGVDCSDHEVNLKILLNDIVAAGDLTEVDRNQLLVEMTNIVAAQVLHDNGEQTQAISYAVSRAKKTLDEHVRFIHTMERIGKLDRSLEFLPTDDQLIQRKAIGQGLTSPEISILIAYSKMYLKEQLLNSNVPEDKYWLERLCTTFLADIGVRYASYLKKHKLHREIIVMKLTNTICHEMGPTFVTRINDETGALPPEIVKSFMLAREVFSFRKILDDIENLDRKISFATRNLMRTDVIRLLRRATRWFLRNKRIDFNNVEKTIIDFSPQVQVLADSIPNLLVETEKVQLEKNCQYYLNEGVPRALALQIANTGNMVSALDIIVVAETVKLPLPQVAKAYFLIGEKLGLHWFRAELDKHVIVTSWDALARAACKDDLDRQQRTITMAILSQLNFVVSDVTQIESWITENQLLAQRWFTMLAELKATKVKEFTMFAVVLRELLALTQAVTRKVT